MPLGYLFLFLAVGFNGFADKLRRAVSVLVDVVFKAFISHIHLAKACQNLMGAIVIIFGDVALQKLHQILRFGR